MKTFFPGKNRLEDWVLTGFLFVEPFEENNIISNTKSLTFIITVHL